jgi:hypothetical protein
MLIFVSLLVLSAASEPVMAVEKAKPNWSFGGGPSVFAYASAPYYSPYALAGLSQLRPMVKMNMNAERRLASGLWLMVNVSGSFSDRQDQTSNLLGGAVSGAGNSLTSRRFGGALGLRYQFDLPGGVELSPYLMIGGEYAWETSTYRQPYYDQTGAYYELERTRNEQGGIVSARLGVVLERELIGGLALRVGTSLVEAKMDFARGEITTAGAPGEFPIAQQSFALGIALEPSIEVRYRF